MPLETCLERMILDLMRTGMLTPMRLIFTIELPAGNHPLSSRAMVARPCPVLSVHLARASHVERLQGPRQLSRTRR